MWPFAEPSIPPAPSIEQVRKHSRILVIDDHVFPAMKNFERDGYHFERGPSVKNLSQLTDGHWHVILLDIQGVGLAESPDLQGLGILRHVKRSNPAQPVIVYSAQPQKVSSSEYLLLADAVIDKGMSYLEYKERVDDLLVRHATPGWFIAAMNRELGESAAAAPKAVAKALRAFRTRDSRQLHGYLSRSLADQDKVDLVVNIIAVGIKLVAAVA